MNTLRYNKGTWFYKILEDDSVDQIRLERIKNEDCFVFTRNRNYREKFKLTKKEFDEYITLTPHGYVTANVVKLDSGVRDVIVTLHRTKDIEEQDSIPYAACRQSILDIFTNLAKLPEDRNIYIGLSLSKDTCPPDIDFNIMLLANDVIYSDSMAVYLDDVLSDILHYIPATRYNEVLMNMPQFKLPESVGGQEAAGHCFTLRQLLEYTDFLYDFKLGFNTLLIDKVIKVTEEGNVNNESMRDIEQLLGFKMFRPYGIEYGYDVDLNEIANSYVIVTDKDNKTYVVSYVKGEDIDKITRKRIQTRMDYITSLKNVLS